jgi:hypothetical protein
MDEHGQLSYEAKALQAIKKTDVSGRHRTQFNA